MMLEKLVFSTLTLLAMAGFAYLGYLLANALIMQGVWMR